MKTQQLLMIAAVLALCTPLVSTGAQSHAYRFQEAIHLMETKGDYPAAIELFEEIALGSDRALAARALLNVGLCYEQLSRAEAVTAYQRITQEFADQLAVVAQARRRLERLEPRQVGSGGAVVDDAHYTLALTSETWTAYWANRNRTAPFDFSPSGDQFVFRAPRVGVLSAGQQAPVGGIYISDHTGSLIRPLLEGEDSLEGWDMPRWSPDGRLIAFVGWRQEGSGGGTAGRVSRVYVVSAEGGAARHVGPDFDGEVWDLCWTADGRHLSYAASRDGGDFGDGIHTIDLRDGAVEVIPLHAHYSLRLGGYSPDGRWLAFGIQNEDNGLHTDKDIWILPATGGRARRLTHAPGLDDHPTWARDGRALYFVSDRSGSANIWKLTLDPDTGLRRDQPEQVTFYSDASVLHPKVLAEGGRLAFFLSKITNVIHVADASRLEDARSLARGHAPQLSPDGEMIYYVGQGPDQEGIFVVSRTGGVPRRLTSSLPANLFTRAFHLSPDGRTLAYFSHQGDGTALFALSVGGGEPRQLLELDAKAASSPAWSPDGSRLAYATGNGLYVLPAAGGQPRKLAHLYSWDAWTVRWSPDGRHLAALGWASPEEEDGPVNSVFLVPSSGGEPRRLTALDEGGYKEGLAWHPDGRRLTYFDYGPETTRHVYLDGRPPTTLFDQPERWEYIGRWSPDGRRYFFESSLGGVWQTFIFDAASGDITRFFPEAGDDTGVGDLVHWSRDGQTIVWTVTNSTGQLWLMDNFR